MTIDKIGTLTAIIVAILGGLYFLYKEYLKKQLKFRKKLQKSWTNEGDITGWKNETHFINIDITTDIEDGEITGLIECRNLTSHEITNNISINGKLRYKKAKIRLSGFIGGKLIIYGKAKIKIKGKLIKWKLIHGDKDLFPKITILWKN